MEFPRRIMNHFLSPQVWLWKNSLILMSSWSTSSKLSQSTNQPKFSSSEDPFSPVNCVSLRVYPWGRSWRTTWISIGGNVLEFVGVIEGLPQGTVKLNGEDYLSSEVGEDKAIVVEEGWISLSRDSEKYARSVVASWVLRGWLLLLWGSDEGSRSKTYVHGQGVFLVVKE